MSETIILKGRGIRKEGIANAVITPGQLLALVGVKQVSPHSSDNTIQSMFAVENELTGEGIDVDYEVGDNVLYEVLPPGAEVYAFLTTGVNGNVLSGAFLESNQDGNLEKAATLPSPLAICVALENVDNSAGSGPVRIKVEVV